MKLRTDFVTNSSSTSFIFKENDLEQHKDEIVQSIRELVMERDRDDQWRMQYDIDRFHEACENTVRIKDMQYFGELIELYEWYLEPRPKYNPDGSQYGVYNTSDFGENTDESPDFDEDYAKNHLSEHGVKRMAADIVLKKIDRIRHDFYNDETRDESGRPITSLSSEQIDEIFAKIDEYFSVSKEIDSEESYEMFEEISEEYFDFWDQKAWLEYARERIHKKALEYADVEAGVIVEELMEEKYGGKYVFFDGDQSDYLVPKAIEEHTSSLVKWNIHMG